MSHAVQINYEQIAVQCHSICEVAENQAAELDRMLADLEGSSSRLLNDQTEALRKQIEKEKSELLKQIKAVLDRADEDAKKGIVTGDSDRLNVGQTRAVITTAEQLRARVNELATGRLAEMRALLDSLLSESIAANQAKMIDRADGVVRLDEPTKAFLDTIDDEILRQFVYIAFVRDSSLPEAALLEAGKALMSESVEARYEKEAELIRAELAAAKVPAETVDKIVGAGTPIAKIREAATNEIVGEKVRQKSMKLIMKAITERGFIVDKKNIKINRETNEVTMVALKASGERATFRIFLDGKFIYDFRGYEGQACQKDIGPFMTALEEVYGMQITEKQEIWSNPDKISTMKYQAINTNKNKR
ncbi:MAG: hypothetical protein ACI4M0_05270 [Christensenellales bacterium]